MESKDIDSPIPLTEVVTCSGFFLVSFLEELIHHFIHPHRGPKKPPLKRHGEQQEASASEEPSRQGGQKQNEFELYDRRRKMESIAEKTNNIDEEESASSSATAPQEMDAFIQGLPFKDANQYFS